MHFRASLLIIKGEYIVKDVLGSGELIMLCIGNVWEVERSYS
jgi:hypothetical protein